MSATPSADGRLTGMDGRDLVRSVAAVAGLGLVRSWWPGRGDAAAVERARVPGRAVGAEPGPGGGVVRFERSALRVLVTTAGAVFCGWDGAEPTPSPLVRAELVEPDVRARLEPHTAGGWRVVSERLTVAVSSAGAVELCTPGGVLLRRDLPPRWWERDEGGPARWARRSEVGADARFFGLGGSGAGLRLGDGVHPVPGGAGVAPVQLVLADAGTHLVVPDGTEPGTVRLAEGAEGAGSGHDRPGRAEWRGAGGPPRHWMAVGTPARALASWAAVAGTPEVAPVSMIGVGGSGGPAARPRTRVPRQGAAAGDGWAAMRAALARLTALGVCGAAPAGAEGDGPGKGAPAEVWVRWWQLGAYLPVFRTGAGPEGWEARPALAELARVALAERRRLLPYHAALGAFAGLTGVPAVRPVWWNTPEDRGLREGGDAFLLGDAFLVVPVLGPGGGPSAVRLPGGRWYDTATGRAYQGGASVPVEVAADRLPVFARAGAVVPVRGADGEAEWEVWAPAPGRTGAGMVVRESGVLERVVSRWEEGRVVVREELPAGRGAEVSVPVRVRGVG
ncbi:TIM-barrel domain-containing protein [Streptomyces sp. B29(2018)]|uniref:TIM-barrel domain-containing protein n=1 Tax=Streptomyces sp. B29(2018) TaxID=2485016 RepID=UPI000FD6228B